MLRQSTCMSGALLAGLLLWTPQDTSAALIVNVGGTAITDNGPHDTNPAAGTIVWDAGDATKGFASNYGVNTGRAFTTALGNGGRITLTDVVITHLAGDTAGPLQITFQDVFGLPPAPGFATDRIDGFFSAGLSSAFKVTPGSSIDFQGFVNGGGVGPAFNFVVPGPAPGPNAPVNFAQPPHNAVFGNGPAWTLLGRVDLSVVGLTDRLQLPGSAIVQIVPAPAATAILLLAGGTCSLRRRRGI